jgi:hypothetical protein
VRDGPKADTFADVLQRLQFSDTDFVTAMLQLLSVAPSFGAKVTATIPAGKLSVVQAHGLPYTYSGAVVTGGNWPVFVTPASSAGVESARFLKVSITAVQAFDVTVNLLAY